MFLLLVLLGCAFSGAQKYPSDILDLRPWKITLPVRREDEPKPLEVKDLEDYRMPPYFTVSGDGVVFMAPVDGFTTKGSKYPRSELREMIYKGEDEKKEKASWSIGSSDHHVLEGTFSIDHLPEVKPEVVCAQIHNDKSKVIMIRLRKSSLYIEVRKEDGSNEKLYLTDRYVLGEKFYLKINAGEGEIQVTFKYNGVKVVKDIKSKSKKCYFKAGCYTQSNTKGKDGKPGDKPGAYGQVSIYALKTYVKPAKKVSDERFTPETARDGEAETKSIYPDGSEDASPFAGVMAVAGLFLVAGAMVAVYKRRTSRRGDIMLLDPLD